MKENGGPQIGASSLWAGRAEAGRNGADRGRTGDRGPKPTGSPGEEGESDRVRRGNLGVDGSKVGHGEGDFEHRGEGKDSGNFRCRNGLPDGEGFRGQ